MNPYAWRPTTLCYYCGKHNSINYGRRHPAQDALVSFENLFPSQQRAVVSTYNRLLILAGPGTGKTEVLTHHAAHLIREAIEPIEVLAVTFSRKAATEMAERLTEFEGIDTSGVRTSYATCGST
jgi:hypothetical protein